MSRTNKGALIVGLLLFWTSPEAFSQAEVPTSDDTGAVSQEATVASPPENEKFMKVDPRPEAPPQMDSGDPNPDRINAAPSTGLHVD